MRYSLPLTLLIAFISCESTNQKEERVAKQYCGTCHLFPQPGLLPKKIWQDEVLPNMAFRMGRVNLMDGVKYFDIDDILSVVSTLPGKPMVNEDEWQAIVNYFLRHAPDSLSIPIKRSTEKLNLFEQLHYYDHEETLPLITFLQVDTVHRDIFYGTRNGKVFQLDNRLNKKFLYQFDSPASRISRDEGSHYTISLMGIMDPNDQPKGSLIQLSDSSKHHEILIDSLQRPVYFEKKDLNADGLSDYVICAFGNYTGALLTYESSNSGYTKHVISNLPGARRTLTKDFNGDGLPDILSLFTQGNEKIMLFLNQGDFKFSQKILLEFPPVYGSSYFDLADFNGDGRFDILYTNGDNSDYSQILKPYHGVRIFLQEANGNFNESWFYPLHGASKAVAADFDLDGDLDIASISFFPDFNNHPEEGFVYFENSNNQFIAQTISGGSAGRWIAMEVADLEGDGDQDILLGALDFESTVPDSLVKQWKKDQTSILILKNKAH